MPNASFRDEVNRLTGGRWDESWRGRLETFLRGHNINNDAKVEAIGMGAIAVIGAGSALVFAPAAAAIGVGTALACGAIVSPKS